jgi:sugar phosphate isomerase/epimerase
VTDTKPNAWILTGFGDEIDPDPKVQLPVLQALGASHIEVRGAWGKSIVDFSDDDLQTLGALLAERSMTVSAIASPVGKVDVELPVEHELERLGRAIRAAQQLGTPFIRIFSFFRKEGVAVESIRDGVLTRMRALADLAEKEKVVLLHENEKEIFGDVPSRVLDIVESVGSDALRLTWDNANFVQVGVRPFDEGYALLRPYVDYLQVKDADAATGAVRPAGEGDGQLLETLTALRDDGFEGFASLEPHLADASAYGGFSGPEAFGRAARAFTRLTDQIGVRLV